MNTTVPTYILMGFAFLALVFFGLNPSWSAAIVVTATQIGALGMALFHSNIEQWARDRLVTIQELNQAHHEAMRSISDGQNAKIAMLEAEVRRLSQEN